ncbi:MAG TPA: SgcJ/EcaC family oxidoreductase [Thermoanaerobaculia bacterium]|nr:SgcJ/EcaC family oxidoreductase [Thermoanaerobaculia bacterium]
MHDDEQAIRDLIDEWQRASTAGDLDRVLRLMDEDVIFLTPGNPPMRGRETFAQGFRTVTQKGRIEGSSEVEEIRVLGDWAYCWTSLSVTMTPLEGGSPTRRSGNTLTIFRKKSDGSWVLFRDANLLGPQSQAS